MQRWGGDYRRHLLCMRAFVCLSIVCEGLGKGDEERDHGRGRDVIKLIDHSIAILLDATSRRLTRSPRSPSEDF